ncbi:hypothetical protein [Streptomyces sp. NPDC086787]|uniref:hypothetical protein n=1 Tax=Streptomyces sp. NPDC086787 TaxID=3365759 RepID=UPI0038194F0E
MIPRSRWAAAAAAAITLSGFAGTASAVGDPVPLAGGGGSDHTVVLHLRTENTGSQTFLPSEGEWSGTVGGQLFSTADLFRDGQPYGHEVTTCVTSSVAPTTHTTLCRGSYLLPDGEITWEHAQRGQEVFPYDVAITGGTGEYKKARGFVRIDRTEESGGDYYLNICL